MDPQGSGTPFLKAGPVGTVRPGLGEKQGGSSACSLAPLELDTNHTQERGAKQRGKVAHTARPGKPGNEDMDTEIDSASERGKEEIRPLEDRTRSAEL